MAPPPDAPPSRSDADELLGDDDDDFDDETCIEAFVFTLQLMVAVLKTELSKATHRSDHGVEWIEEGLVVFLGYPRARGFVEHDVHAAAKGFEVIVLWHFA